MKILKLFVNGKEDMNHYDPIAIANRKNEIYANWLDGYNNPYSGWYQNTAPKFQVKGENYAND